MDSSERETLLQKLRERREQIGVTLAALDESSRPVELDQTVQGRLSRIDAITQQQMARAGRTNLQTELGRIDAALKRAVEGGFGNCCRCHEAIDADRLRADPAVPLCIDCIDEMAEERREQELRGR